MLTPREHALLLNARRAVLCTIAEDGSPRPVPVCFTLGPGRAAEALPRIYTPLDDKPKRVADPRRLARVRDIQARPAVSLLVDRWEEDWTRLAWLRLTGHAALIEPGDADDEHREAVWRLRDKYPQYATHDLGGRPLIRVVVTAAHSWGALV